MYLGPHLPTALNLMYIRVEKRDISLKTPEESIWMWVRNYQSDYKSVYFYTKVAQIPDC